MPTKCEYKNINEQQQKIWSWTWFSNKISMLIKSWLIISFWCPGLWDFFWFVYPWNLFHELLDDAILNWKETVIGSQERKRKLDARYNGAQGANWRQLYHISIR